MRGRAKPVIPGKSIHIYLRDGGANQRYQVTLDNWNVMAYKVPSSMVNQSSDLENIVTAGVYFLFGYQDKQKAVYVGEAEDVYRRLLQHDPEKDGYIWDDAVAFVSGDKGAFDKAKIKYLENRLYNLIKDAKSYALWNKNEPTKSQIYQSTEDAMETVIENIRLLIPVLGYTIFKKKMTAPKSVASATYSEEIFYIKAKGITAKCRLNADRTFTLLSGSQISDKPTHSLRPNIVKLRQNLVDSGKAQKGILLEDSDFESSSTLASVVLGTQSDGKRSLKTADGKTLGKYEEEVKQNGNM